MKLKSKPRFQPPVEEIQEEFVEYTQPPVEAKPKLQISEQQWTNLVKAREKAKERKKELAELNAKSKGLKEEQLRKDAEEYDQILEEKERYRQQKEQQKKQQELEETLQKIEKEKKEVPVPEKPKQRKVKKIIYEPDSDEEEEEEEVVVVKQKSKPKPKPPPPSYSDLANMSVEQQIKDKLQQEKIHCFFNQLTGKKY